MNGRMIFEVLAAFAAVKRFDALSEKGEDSTLLDRMMECQI